MPSSRQAIRAQRELYSQILEGDVLIFKIDDLLVLKATNGWCSFFFISIRAEPKIRSITVRIQFLFLINNNNTIRAISIFKIKLTFC